MLRGFSQELLIYFVGLIVANEGISLELTCTIHRRVVRMNDPNYLNADCKHLSENRLKHSTEQWVNSDNETTAKL